MSNEQFVYCGNGILDQLHKPYIIPKYKTNTEELIKYIRDTCKSNRSINIIASAKIVDEILNT